MVRRRVRERNRARDAADQLGDDYKFTRDPVLASERAERRKTRRATSQKAAEARIDRWETCIAPGCESQTTSELTEGVAFPICFLHAAAVWEMVELADQRGSLWFSEAIKAMNDRRAAMRADRVAADAEETAQWRDDVDAGRVLGTMYFVKIGELVKVGWSSVPEQRLKQYGASAEVLCHYPASRADETTLHRQLRPALAKGREWYLDGDIIATFVADALTRHGPPTILPFWTEPKRIVGSKHNKGLV